MSATIYHGVITKYECDRKFGFIECREDKETYFFHISSLEHQFTIVPNKTEVIFKPGKNDKGNIALQIKEDTEIEGEFKDIQLSNKYYYMTNKERIEHLKEEHAKVVNILDALKSCGIGTIVAPNEWISLDLYALDSFEDPDTAEDETSHLECSVPSGYSKTATHILRLLEKEINNLNHDYLVTQKGIEGEEMTLKVLQSISLNYPMLRNVTLKAQDYTAESDVIIITDKAIFLIETKNYGGKNDTIKISEDGRWTIYNHKRHTEKILHNPCKQIIDHKIVIKRILDEKNTAALPIIPIVAIANESVNLEISPNAIDWIKIMRSEMIGAFILNYIESNPAVISNEEVDDIKTLILEESEKYPPKKYRVLDHCQNIQDILVQFQQLLTYYLEDCEKAAQIAAQIKERERIAREKEENKDVMLGFAALALKLIKDHFLPFG